MAYNQERQGDLLVETNQDSPSQILHHITVLVLARTIVSMQMQIGLAKTVGVEKVVQHADDAVGSLSSVHRLVNQVIDLLKGCTQFNVVLFLIKSHLSRYCLTAHTKDGTFPRGEEVHWPWLLRI